MIRGTVRTLRRWYADHVASKADEGLQKALRDQARQTGEATYHSVLAGFYRERADGTDHTTNWWGYADAMQKWHDNETSAMWHESKAQECAAKVAARRAQLQGTSNG